MSSLTGLQVGKDSSPQADTGDTSTGKEAQREGEVEGLLCLPTGILFRMLTLSRPFCMAGSFPTSRSELKYHFSEKLSHHPHTGLLPHSANHRRCYFSCLPYASQYALREQGPQPSCSLPVPLLCAQKSLTCIGCYWAKT